MVLQRVVDGTSRTGQGVGLSWANLGQGQGASAVNAQGTPVNQTTMGAYYSRATSVASSSVPQAAGGANPVTPSPTVTNPMFGGAYLGLTSTAGPTPMAYSTLVPPGTARSAFPTYGGYSLSGLPITNLPGLTNATPMGATPSMGFGPSITPVGLSAGTPQVGSTYVQASVNAGGSATQASTATTTVTAYGGMPSRIKNAVKMIQPFYSDESTVEKARAFWNAFERATVGLEEQLRLSAFRGCLKGKTAEDWWMYSIIPDFETLRTRFHNQFVCLTPLQMIERLRNAKRTRGMSAEVWGDLISGLCNEVQCYDPQMRYQYFLSGLRNREWKAALNTLMVNSIEGAVIVLLAKNMHQPVEDDADFVDAVTGNTPSESTVVLQMMQMLQQTQNLILQQQQDLARSHRPPSHPTYAAAAYEEPSQASTPHLTTNPQTTVPRTQFHGIRQGPDQYTQEGQVVCGRCHILGCCRINCQWASSTCPICGIRGHIEAECEAPRSQPGSSGGSQRPGRRFGEPRTCYACQRPGHLAAQCPTVRAISQAMSQNDKGGQGDSRPASTPSVRPQQSQQ
ncbi:hypothetical protein PF008_g27364 [Phytophthora fragariae]|uniref:CCHC-type domain-containing protein n=1 Tax=Phytophthora fragariae TaxID=53985 RepID=A0A6G0QEI4_9STRA|nr:hypothetical protein PF008_g27364 [Phytophthora fragariae]